MPTNIQNPTPAGQPPVLALAHGSAPSFFRRLQCRLGLCGGHMEHERDANGVWWIGLRCTATGTLHGPIKSRHQDLPNVKDEPQARQKTL
jgi:hypothetical protein